MIGFYLKKTFWDGWDNLVSLALGNAPWLGLAAMAMWGLARAPGGLLGAFAVLASCTAAGVHAVAFAGSARAMAAGEGRPGAAYRAALGSSWGTGALGGSLAGLGALGLAVAVPYYAALGGLAGTVAIGLLLWLVSWLGLALQWLPAVAALTTARGFAALRRCFSLLAGNPGLGLFLAAQGLATLALSLPLAFLAPGPAGVTLATVEALRLDLLRYRWLAGAGEDAARGKAPWAELLAPERERLGRRSLREALFFGKPGRRRGR